MLSAAIRPSRLAGLVAVTLTLSCSSTQEPALPPITVALDAPSSGIIVGSTGAVGGVTLNGRVSARARVSRFTFALNQDAELVIALVPDGDDAKFTVSLPTLAHGKHTVVVRAYDQTDRATSVTIPVEVVPPLRVIAVPDTIADVFPRAVNERGDVAGYWMEANVPTWHAFVHTGGITHSLATAGEWRSAATDINESSEVSGYIIDTPTSATARALRWRDRVPQAFLGHPGSAAAINDAGALTGSAVPANGPANGPPRAFLFSGSQATLFGDVARWTVGRDINGKGVVVASALDVDGSVYGIAYEGGVMRAVPGLGGMRVYPNAINDSGVVAGYSENPPRTAYLAFIARGTTARQPDYGGRNVVTSFAYGMNYRGMVVGEMYQPVEGGVTISAFVAVDDRAFDLNEVIASETHHIITAYSISDRGEIAAVVVRRDDPDGRFRPALLALPAVLGTGPAVPGVGAAVTADFALVGQRLDAHRDRAEDLN